MKFKSDVPVLLRDFIVMVHTQFNKKIKMFRSYNGGEFFNSTCKELFQSHEILHQSSCPYTPQQNGVVEWRHHHILEIARAIRIQGHLPAIYWGHYIQAVVYIINRVPSTVLQNKSPHEMLFHEQANLSHLRVIGCLCFATDLTTADKFGPRAVRSMLLGYAPGYKLLNLENGVHFVSRDATFMKMCFHLRHHLIRLNSPVVSRY